jgi:hypothetical protein
MSDYPKEWAALAAECLERHADNIPACVEELERVLKDRPEYEGWQAQLVTYAIRRLVHESRHRRSKCIKQAAGMYGQEAAVHVGRSKAAQVANSCLYNLCIGGVTLGSLLGRDLGRVADSERRVGNGHLLNAAFLEALAPLVPSDRCVRDAVSAKRLLAVWMSCKEQFRDNDQAG